MKYMMTLISMSILLLAACGQTPAETSSAEAKPTEQVSESESTDQQNEDEETMDAETEDENQDTENATDAENSETGSTEETETETTSTETESAVTATGTSDADAETEVDDEQVTTETDQGVDEIADPSYTEVTSDDYQDQIATLKNQFQNQLLSIELENGEDWGYVYAVVTDGLKLPSDEEREFHLQQMAEAITEQLDLKAQAPGGTITFVYEDQSVLGIYHTEDGSIGYP